MRTLVWISVFAFASVANGQGLPHVVSGPPPSSDPGSGASSAPIPSRDDRFIVFLSEAKNLSTSDDLAPFTDVFRYDRESGEMRLISKNMTGMGGGNGNSGYASVSSNGQWIAFSSFANDLVSSDTNSAEDVFLHDAASGTIFLISAGEGGVPPTEPSRSARLSTKPIISTDGRWVAFESRAMNLVMIGTHLNTNAFNIYVRDTASNATTLVTKAFNTSATASADSELTGLTPDGRYILYTSTATNLHPATALDPNEQVYLHDRVSGQTMWISKDIPLLFTNAYRCINPTMSDDGKAVAFLAGLGLLALYDVDDSQTSIVASNVPPGSWPQISTDGRYLAYEDSGAVYFRDIDSSSTTLIASAPARSPVFNPEATRLAYTSGPTNGPMQIYVRDLASGETWLVSANLFGSTSSEDHAFASFALNSSGSLIFFDSNAKDLVRSDENAVSDIFMRDLFAEQTSLISRRDPGRPATTLPGISTLVKNGISEDGSAFLFKSHDVSSSPLVNQQWEDAFVTDLTPPGGTSSLQFAPGAGSLGTVWEAALSGNGQFVAASLQAYGTEPRNLDLIRVDRFTGAAFGVRSSIAMAGLSSFPSLTPSLSHDGNWIVYSDLSQVYLANCAAATNHLLSHRNGIPEYAGTARSFDPVLSFNGQWVAFGSSAPDLLTNTFADNIPKLYLRNLAAQQNFVIATNLLGDSYQAQPVRTAFSGDSQFLVFATRPNSIFRHGISNSTTALVCTDCDFPSISGDGALIAYESHGTNIALKNMHSGATTLVSKSVYGQPANGPSKAPALSRDGRFVAFVSKATDLVVGDHNGWADIFIHDVATGQLLRIAGALPESVPGGGPASQPVMGPDGRTLIFQSFSGHLVAGDYNHTRDIFVLKLGAGDSDNDALPDDWEVAYFGDLARDGTADFDEDGHGDLQEYVAGTDPTNAGSILRVITLTSPRTGTTQVFWSAIAGKTYRVEYKPSLADTNWTALPTLVTAQSSTASLVDPDAGFRNVRFYRVVAVN